MIVAASTECYHELPLIEAISKLRDLEYTSVEITLHENSNQVKPSQVQQCVDKAIALCRDTHRLNIVGYSVEIEAEGEKYYKQFEAICELAKATKVVTLTVPSGEHGTPFNQEVEKLRRLVAIAELQGVRVGIRSQIGRLSEDADTVSVLCDNVKGLGLTFDPSHYICGPHQGKSVEKLMKYVYHVLLRDTKKDQLQVRVGQGEVDYGKLVNQLERVKYDRALGVHITEMPDVDHMVELRKMRLLLDSLL
ncbi:MAG: xylose isomerase [Planctomycetaceae bacterium]|nr:xylose isomerase [Planctomycetaceae bacterium]